MNKLVMLLLVLVISAPVALLGTLLLLPFWRWLEESSGLESIGHSGPASWCYVVVYVSSALAAVGVWRFVRRRTAS